MNLTRRELIGRGAAAGAGICVTGGVPALFAARGAKVKIGATDWNLRKEAKLDAVELSKRIGFDGVEVSLGVGGNDKLPLDDPSMIHSYREEARKNNTRIASTCLNILHRNYLKNDPLGQKWVRDSIPVSKALGAHVILLPFFGKGAVTQRSEQDYVADFMKEVGPEAEKTGVILGLENTISAEDNARILDRAGSKAVSVYYDVGNSTYNGFDILKEIRWLGKDRICEFHFKDNPHYLGEGKIDFPAVVQAVSDIGFQGWIHLETDAPSKDVEADMGRNLKFIRDLFARVKA
jgi:sugar phosphate isomerase/epimerase